MCAQGQLDLLLKSIAEIYKQVYGDDIVNIILYGSYARGTHDEDSDIDIAAIVHGERYSLQKKLTQVWEKTHDLGLEYDTLISPTVIPHDEFMDYKEVIPYYRNIEKEGISIATGCFELKLDDIREDATMVRPYDHVWDMYYDEFDDYKLDDIREDAKMGRPYDHVWDMYYDEFDDYEPENS